MATTHPRRRFRTLLIWLSLPVILLGLTAWQLWAQVKGKVMSKVGITVEMPGKSHQGPLPQLTAEQAQVRDQLQTDLVKLARDIGERNLHHAAAYAEATKFMEDRLTAAGYKVRRQIYQVKGRPCVNLEAEIPGTARAKEIVVIGAHYDSAIDTPGANDNGSGAVALLALADLLKRAGQSSVKPR